MKKKYLGSGTLLILITCGIMLNRNFKENDFSEKSTLPDKQFGNVDFKNGKPTKSEMFPTARWLQFIAALLQENTM